MCDDLILVFDHSQSSMGMFQLMHSHFIFLDSVKAILVNCAHRLLSELTLILCTGTRLVEGDLDDYEVTFWQPREKPNQAMQSTRWPDAMTLIEIKPYPWGWKVFEGRGVEPVFPEKQDAIEYAETRACFRSGEIRVLDSSGKLERTIAFSEADRKL
jgi:hypothetical protein